MRGKGLDSDGLGSLQDGARGGKVCDVMRLRRLHACYLDDVLRSCFMGRAQTIPHNVVTTAMQTILGAGTTLKGRAPPRAREPRLVDALTRCWTRFANSADSLQDIKGGAGIELAMLRAFM